NTGQAAGTAPLLDKKLWSRPIFMDKIPGFNGQDPDERAEAHVKAAIKQVNDLKRPVLPGFFPIASQDILVYRTHLDVRAVALKNLNFKDDQGGPPIKVMAGEILWKSIPMSRSLSVLSEGNQRRPEAKAWLDAFERV